jgi:hypothetical protein
MTVIEKPKQLRDYLEQEIEIKQQSSQRWGPELKAASDLALLYDRLTILVRISDPLMFTLADLFLVAQSHFQRICQHGGRG